MTRAEKRAFEGMRADLVAVRKLEELARMDPRDLDRIDEMLEVNSLGLRRYEWDPYADGQRPQ